MTDFVRLARAEKDAERAAERAKGKFYHCWWDVSLSTREPDAPLGEMAELLGKSVRYMKSRRQAAKAIDQEVIDSGLVYSLPPRMALAYVIDHKRTIDKAAADNLINWDTDGVGIRGLAEQLGEQNYPSWQSADERAAATPEPTAEQVVTAIRENAFVRQAVVSDPAAKQSLYRAEDEHTRERLQERYGHAGKPDRPEPPDNVQFDRFQTINNGLHAAKTAMRDVVNAVRDYSPDRREATRWGVSVEDIQTATNFVRDALQGTAQFNEEIRALLEQEG